MKFSKRLFLFTLVIFATSLLMYYLYPSNYLPSPNGILNQVFQPAANVFNVNEATNYFETSAKIASLGYIVNTPQCRIPNISMWDPSIIPLVNDQKSSRRDTCGQQMQRWTYVDNDMIVVNKTALAEVHLSLDSVFCCYKMIKRVEQSENSYSKKADRRIIYSTSCFQMYERTLPKGPFLKVQCKLKNSRSNSVLYQNFHAVSILPENSKEFPGPATPNVLIIGIDSTSRLNFARNMPQTKKFLETLNAVEFLGYTKVGENTFPNVVPMLTGYSEDNLKHICYFSRKTTFDLCPFIWKKFQESQYVTEYAEDAPIISAFNYLKAGFRVKPVDLYLRPFMLGVYRHQRSHSLDCIGYQSIDEVILNYLRDTISQTKSRQIPLFSMIWLSDYTHDNMNAIRSEDDLYLDFLKGLVDKGHLNNTIMFFLSDHGYRFGAQRETFSGWYEDKLPNLWVYVSPDVLENNPDWRINLISNARKLTSPYDIYETLVHILDKFTRTSPFPSSQVKDQIKGKSLFLHIPVRSCQDAGIPQSYCPCFPPVTMPLEDHFVSKSAALVVSEINSLTPTQCANLSLHSVTAAATMKLNLNDMDNENVLSNYGHVIVVTFVTTPGYFRFEAQVTIFSTNISTVTSRIQRLNRITRKVDCISDPVIERFCYCLN